MRRLKIAITTMILAVSGTIAHANINTIVVNLANGNSSEIYLDEGMQASFTSDDMIFESQRVKVTVSRAEIKSFDFIETTGVQDITANIGIDVSNDGINLYNLPEKSTVEVYDINGREIFLSTVAGDISISAEQLTKGINIVRINGATYKILFK